MIPNPKDCPTCKQTLPVRIDSDEDLAKALFEEFAKYTGTPRDWEKFRGDLASLMFSDAWVTMARKARKTLSERPPE